MTEHIGHWKGTDGKEYDFRMYPRPGLHDYDDEWEAPKQVEQKDTERGGNAESDKPGRGCPIYNDASNGPAR